MSKLDTGYWQSHKGQDYREPFRKLHSKTNQTPFQYQQKHSPGSDRVTYMNLKQHSIANNFRKLLKVKKSHICSTVWIVHRFVEAEHKIMLLQWMLDIRILYLLINYSVRCPCGKVWAQFSKGPPSKSKTFLRSTICSLGIFASPARQKLSNWRLCSSNVILGAYRESCHTFRSSRRSRYIVWFGPFAKNP